jgi:hypothetical protein
VWCYMPLIPAFGRLRQEDLEFEANLSYIVSVSKKKKKNQTRSIGRDQIIEMFVDSIKNLDFLP